MRNLSLEKAKREYQSKVEEVAERLIRQGVPPWTAHGMAIEEVSKRPTVTFPQKKDNQ